MLLNALAHASQKTNGESKRDYIEQWRLTTHSTGLPIDRSFIFNVDSSPFNSGVRPQNCYLTRI
jgi:hypothetical protein